MRALRLLERAQRAWSLRFFFCGLGSLGGKSGLPPALRVLDEADTSLPPCSLGPPSLAAFPDVATALGGSEPAPSTLQLALSSGGRLPRKGHRLVQRSVNEQPNQFLPEAATKREEQQGKWEGNYITEHCETASSTTIRYGARHRNLSGAGKNRLKDTSVQEQLQESEQTRYSSF